jgi:hypothetical protein
LKRPAPCLPFSTGLIPGVVLFGNVLLSRDNLEGSIFGLVVGYELGEGDLFIHLPTPSYMSA